MIKYNINRSNLPKYFYFNTAVFKNDSNDAHLHMSETKTQWLQINIVSTDVKTRAYLWNAGRLETNTSHATFNNL